MRISYTKLINFWAHLGLLLLPVQLGHFYFPYAIFGLSISQFAFPIYFLDLFFLLGFILAIFFRYRPGVFIKGVIPFVVFFAIKLWFSPYRILTIYPIIKIFILWQWWQMLSFVKFKRSFEYILGLQLLFLLILGGLQIYLGSSLQGLWYFLGERAFNLNTPGIATLSIFGQKYLRAYATFDHPNILAGYTSLVFIWIYLRKSSNLFVKNLSLFFAFILILMTWSQVAWFGLLIFLVLRWLYTKGLFKNKKNLSYLKLGSLLFVIISPFILLGLNSIGSQSVVVRNQIFISSLLVFAKNIIWGVPWPGAQLLFNQLGGMLVQVKYLQPVHNLFWWLLEFVGGAGLLIFYKNLKKIYQFLLNLESLPFVSLVFILITASFDHYWLTGLQTLWLGLFFVKKVVFERDFNKS